eukprot:s211_g15.t1
MRIMTVVDGQWRPGKQPQRWNYEPAELFRPVSAPSLGVRPLWLSSPWHGPAGGHDQNYNYEAAVTVFFDIFDVFSWFGDVFEKLFDDHAEKFGTALQAFFLTLQLVHLLAEASLSTSDGEVEHLPIAGARRRCILR